MWNSVKDVFQRHTLLNKICARRAFYTASMQENEKILSYLNRVKHLAANLKAMDVKIDDEELAMAAFMGLPSRFDNLLVAFDALGDTEKFTFDYVKSRLLQEEQRSDIRDKTVNAKAESSALFNKSQGKNGNNRPHCNNCNRFGHWTDKCWGKNLKDNKNRKFNNDKNKKEKGNSAFVIKEESDDEDIVCLMAKVRNFFPSLSTPEFTAPHVDDNKQTSFESYTNAVNQEASLVSASNALAQKSPKWHIDPGASSHMACDRADFKDYSEVSSPNVVLGDKSVSKSAGKGTVELTLDVQGKLSKCRLDDVMHIPTFGFNLLSVSALCKKGLKVEFEGEQCRILKRNKLVATGHLEGDLFVLDTHNTVPDQHAYVADLKLWHERLAHVFADGITHMAKHNVVKGLENLKHKKDVDKCAACVYGKGHRLPFPKQSETRSKGLLDLVHTDVCGLLSVSSKGGAKYFVSFTDDYSKWTVVYPMKLKSEAFHYFKVFHKYAETHTGRKIHAVE